MDNDQPATGGCACGAVRFEAIGKPIDVAYCHCSDCREFTGAPVVAWVAFASQNVKFVKGERKVFESSPGIGWGFCSRCGGSLSWEGNSLRYSGTHITEFLISTLDNPEDYIPDRHWFESEKIPWFEIADDLPRYQKLDHEVSPTHIGPKQ